MSDSSTSDTARPSLSQNEPAKSLLDTGKVSLYLAHNGTEPIEPLTLRAWLKKITNGEWRKPVLQARPLYPGPRPYEKDKTVQKAYKLASQPYKEKKDQLPC